MAKRPAAIYRSHEVRSMTPFHAQALATDYDGTLAVGGRVSADTLDALARWRDAGRRLLLVTGRQLEDLLAIFPDAPIFDRIVAENGALLHDPASGTIELFGAPPEPDLLHALRARGVPLSLGRIIAATREPHGTIVKETLAELGGSREVILNGDAVMILPRGVNKASGLRAALTALGVDASATAGIGDAENDVDLLRACGLRVAVADALPALKHVAHEVTPSGAGAGVVELVDRLLR